LSFDWHLKLESFEGRIEKVGQSKFSIFHLIVISCIVIINDLVVKY
jgi:hypothetical protein